MAAILDLWISRKLQERAEIEQKVIRTNRRTLIWDKNINVKERRVIFLHLKRDFPLSEKNDLSKIGWQHHSQSTGTDDIKLFPDRFPKKSRSFGLFAQILKKISQV